MNYEFDQDNLSKAFEMMDDAFGKPVQPDEVTAAMLYAEDNSITMRTYLNRLKRLVEQGKMTVRTAKQGELAFKPVEDE